MVQCLILNQASLSYGPGSVTHLNCINILPPFKCTAIRRENLSNVGLPALVLLRAGVLLKQSSLVGNGPWATSAAIGNIKHCGDGRYGAVVMLRDRDLRHQGGKAVYLRLRDCGQERAGVRPVTWTHWDLEDKDSWSITSYVLYYSYAGN